MTFSTSSKSARWAADAPAMQVLLLLLLGVVLWLVYSPGLSGPYVFDDFQNITRNTSVAITSLSMRELMAAAFSMAEGGIGRPIPMVSFALNYYFNGQNFEPFSFKLTNLLIHMANVLLVYVLLRQFFQSAAIASPHPGGQIDRQQAVLLALVAAALWGLHPLQLTSVLYAVQRMTSLAAFFVLLGMIVFVQGRRSFARRPIRGMLMMTAGIGGGTVLGLLCKENAILLPLLAVAVEVGLFSRRELARASRRMLAIFYLCIFGIPAVIAISYVLLYPEFIIQTYVTRDYNATERVLTQSRALFFYLSLILFPLISRFGLFHDDFPLSTGLLEPVTTLLSLVAWTAIVVVMITGLRQRALWAFGLAWFLAGHALESSIIGLEIIHEHRNYVPSIGICMAGTYYLWLLLEKVRFSARTLIACGFSVLLTVSFVTHTRALSWSSRTQLFESMAKHHPNSYRAINGLAISLVERGRDVRPIYHALRDAAVANPAVVHPLVEMKKILHALFPLSDRFEPVDPEVAGNDRPSVTWTSDLVLDRERLLELDTALSPEISRRLKSGSIHVETVHALRRLQECVSSGGSTCAALSDEALDWHLSALAQLPPKDTRRGGVELSTAKLYAVRGDLDRALEYTDRSIETMSGHPRYLAQKAILMIELGAIEQAEKITDLIEQKMDWRKIYAGDVRVLRREIEHAKLRREQVSLGASSRELPLVSPF